MISGHPLGGCAMADGADSGVVNHKGQVFSGTISGSDVHAGLYVMDGSVVPTALGVNPLFLSMPIEVSAEVPIEFSPLR